MRGPQDRWIPRSLSAELRGQPQQSSLALAAAGNMRAFRDKLERPDREEGAEIGVLRARSTALTRGGQPHRQLVFFLLQSAWPLL
jgi:hypothetical protein